MFDPIEGVNIFSNPERGVRPSELINALKDVPEDISLVCSKVLNINMIKDGAIVGKIELNNHITGIENNRVVADIPMLKEIVSTVERDPGSTGGDQATFNDETYTFGGTIAYYEAGAGGFPPVAGNYVGVQITPPEGTEVDRATATFTYVNAKGKRVTLVNGTTAWLESAGDYVWYYPLVNGSRRIFEIEINWNPLKYKSEKITITVADNAELKTEATEPVFGVKTIEKGSEYVTAEATTVATAENTITISGTIPYQTESILGHEPGNLYELKITLDNVAKDTAAFKSVGSQTNTYAAADNWMDGNDFFCFVGKADKAQDIVITIDNDGDWATTEDQVSYTIKIAEDAVLDVE